MAELLDALLMLRKVGSSIARCESSSLLTRTILIKFKILNSILNTNKTHGGIARRTAYVEKSRFQYRKM